MSLKKFSLPDAIYYCYVLRLVGNRFYVGITSNPVRRFRQHQTGRGASVTKRFRPLAVEAVFLLGEMSYKEAERFEDVVVLYNRIATGTNR